MNFEIKSKNKFIVKINNCLIDEDEKNIEENIKKILLNIKKKYAIDIYGFYDVDIYEIKKLITIFIFSKKDDDDYYRKTIDLRINKHEKELTFSIDDYSILKKYKNIDLKNIKGSEIDSNDIFKICEHYQIETLNLQ